MNPKEILVIALDAETDRAAARLMEALRKELSSAEAGYVPEAQPLQASLEPRFFGVGGDEMRSGHAELICEWQNADFDRVYHAALEHEPDLILCLGNSPFHGRLAHALKRYVQKHSGTFFNWPATIVLVDLDSESAGEMNRSEFDAITPCHDEEHTTAQWIVWLLERQMRDFPLKAALTS